MKSELLLLISGLLAAFCSPTLAADHPVAHREHDRSLQFIENKGQWDKAVRYKAALPGGQLFLQPAGFTFSFQDTRALDDLHHRRKTAATSLKAHAYSVQFEGASAQALLQGREKVLAKRNYYQGTDKAKWVSEVPAFREVFYQELYPGTGLHLYQQEENLKYDLLLEKGANPNLIQMRYQGQDQLTLKNGSLHISTSLGEVVEQKPVAYQTIKGKRVDVACHFRLRQQTVSFELPDGYNRKYPLIIDPVLVFSSFSGSTADNWGYTATFDTLGNSYSGGIVFDVGFPTSVGAYDLSFNGLVDIGILKYNANATSQSNALLYATYLGGSELEVPHSLVVNQAGELIILGSTSSQNFPITAGAFDQSHNGGPQFSIDAGFINYANGADLFLAKLSPTGSALTASTYLGGSGTDGVLEETNILVENYGDSFRGDVFTDDQDQVWIASSTTSSNFPVANGFQNNLSGDRDAVLSLLSPDLSTLLFSSYFGGLGTDAAYSIQQDPLGDVYISGGTTSSNLPATAGAMQPAYQGSTDGFVAKISGPSLIRTSYLGTSAYDQSYFVQTDFNGLVYLLGQTKGTYPVSSGVYSVPNTKQFIHRLSNDLTSTSFSTTFGAGTQINISPTAFLIDECGKILLSGWGGSLRDQGSFTTTFGMAVTPGCFQPNTDGNDFYIMQLAEDAASLDYATYFGGSGGFAGDHVDGGTSRFDKRGIVYQAVCAGCGGASFPTTPNAWSQVNGSFNCNQAVFKFDLPQLQPGFSSATTLNGTPTKSGCAPLTLVFKRNQTNTPSLTTSYLWDFGDTNSSTLPGPINHTFTKPGTYLIRHTVTDSTSCQISASRVDTITVFAPLGDAGPDTSLCEINPVTLHATGGATSASYTWRILSGTINSLDSFSGPNPVATPRKTTYYEARITDSRGCIRIDTIAVLVPQKLRFSVTATPQTGNPPLEVQFSNFTSGTTSSFWNFGDGASSTEKSPSHVYLKTGKYYVTLTSFYSLSCQQTDTVAIIDVPGDTPNVITPNGDDTNQFFRSELRPYPVKLQVFNRWGKLVHEAADYRDDWSGDGQPGGIYYYQLTAADGHLRKGWLEIIR